MSQEEQLEQLVFKRFPPEKQEQVRGLVSYTMLMGLTGKDLVSIGGKLTRLALAQTKKSNSERISDFECLPVQKNGLMLDTDNYFRLKTPNGSYKFNHMSGHRWEIVSTKTKTVKRYIAHNQDAVFVGSKYRWGRYNSDRRKQLLLDIANGHLVLDF